MGKGRRAHHRLDECRNPEGTPKRDEHSTIPQLLNTQSVLVDEYIGNNGCRVVRIGLPPRIVIGEDLPADYDLGIEIIEVKQEDDHLSQKQKAQKRGYLNWLFWR